MWLLRIRTWTLATAMTAGVRFYANAQFVVERSPFLDATEARVRATSLQSRPKSK
jgi:hypothetical protein